MIDRDEQADDAATEYARKWLPYNLADDEMHDPHICPKHGKMNWWKGPCGEQNWVCNGCYKEEQNANRRNNGKSKIESKS